ncbi:MAG: hypothetical protein QM692_17980 [Thermomicrobiales bacterium]
MFSTASPARRCTWIGRPWPAGGSEQLEQDRENLREALTLAFHLASEHEWDTVWIVTRPFGARSQREAVMLKCLRAQTGLTALNATMRYLEVDDLARPQRAGIVAALYPDFSLLLRLQQISWPHGLVVAPSADHPATWTYSCNVSRLHEQAG